MNKEDKSVENAKKSKSLYFSYRLMLLALFAFYIMAYCVPLIFSKTIFLFKPIRFDDKVLQDLINEYFSTSLRATTLFCSQYCSLDLILWCVATMSFIYIILSFAFASKPAVYNNSILSWANCNISYDFTSKNKFFISLSRYIS